MTEVTPNLTDREKQSKSNNTSDSNLIKINSTYQMIQENANREIYQKHHKIQIKKKLLERRDLQSCRSRCNRQSNNIETVTPDNLQNPNQSRVITISIEKEKKQQNSFKIPLKVQTESQEFIKRPSQFKSLLKASNLRTEVEQDSCYSSVPAPFLAISKEERGTSTSS